MAVRRGAVVLLWAYAVQFIAGMVLNLFVTLPDAHPGANGTEYFATSWRSLEWSLSGAGGWALFTHAAIAVLLSVGSLLFFLSTLRPGGHGWRWLTGIAALFTIGAGFNGLSFVDYDHDFSSMIMALCWLVAVGAIVTALVRRRPYRRGARS
jgi:hypothetical protein